MIPERSFGSRVRELLAWPLRQGARGARAAERWTEQRSHALLVSLAAVALLGAGAVSLGAANGISVPFHFRTPTRPALHAASAPATKPHAPASKPGGAMPRPGPAVPKPGPGGGAWHDH